MENAKHEKIMRHRSDHRQHLMIEDESKIESDQDDERENKGKLV